MARDAGSLLKLDTALRVLSVTEAIGGTPRRAIQYLEQVRELRRAIGGDAEHVIDVAVLAKGYGGVRASDMSGLATVEIAEGHYDDAFARLKPFIDEPFLHVTAAMYPDFAEAATRGGHLAEAAATVEKLELIADVSGSTWAIGAARRARATLEAETRAGSDPELDIAEVERLFTAAVEALQGSGALVELGRAHLALGEWLRRLKRRRDARPHLRAAAECFTRAGAGPFADRAHRELEATGETAHVTDARRPADLTQQEMTVAELAASGRTNAEIAATMFLSSNTIDYHLRKVFQKLGISSRRQLLRAARNDREVGPTSRAVGAIRSGRLRTSP